MKANVKITKSFDDGKEFGKEYLPGDFSDFFIEEGSYLDQLAEMVVKHGNPGEGFTVTYVVTISK